MPAKKHSASVPAPTSSMGEDATEVLSDALDMMNKSSEGAYEDIQEAFKQIPKEQLAHAAAICRDLGNEAVKAGRHEEAAEHYTSCLAAFPADHEVLCNRSLCYMTVGEQKGGPRMDEYFQLALQDAALAVNLKPTWPKGLYRLGCALQKCKQWKDSVAVFTKVCEMEPDNSEASGRLIQAREMLQMVLNVERVNDPLWMHKPEPPKTELQQRAEAAQGEVDKSMSAMREALGKCAFDFSLLDRQLSPKDKWYTESQMATALASHLAAHSSVLAPRTELEALDDRARTDIYAEAIRAYVPMLVPRGQSGVVLHLGSAMGLLPLLSMEAGANKVYICEPHGFLAKLAYAGVQRHTMLTFERENWQRLPMNVALSERVKQAGSIAFRAGQYERAISLYTEALPPTDPKPDLKCNLLANRALCYLKLGEPESALQDAVQAVRCLPDFGKGYYRMAQALVDLGRISEARKKLHEVLRVSKNGKNADASKLLDELNGREDFTPAPKGQQQQQQGGGGGGNGSGSRGGGGGGATRGAGASAARRALIREDRAKRLSVQEVNDQLVARCEHFSVLHKPYDSLRMHHELHAKPDFVLCHNIDYSLLGQGLVLAINNLKKEECLRKDATVLPAAARVWAMGVQVKTDTGLPIDMQPLETLMWSTSARQIHMDEVFERRIIKPLTKPATALAFDFRASAPQIRREERFELEMSVIDDGRCNGVVFWYELHMGQLGYITTAPSAIPAPEGSTRIAVGQALHYLPLKVVEAGEKLPLLASHNRTRITFAHRDLPLPAPRRGLVLDGQFRVMQDGHFNRTFAAATRKAIFSYPSSKGVLVIHVGSGVGTLSIVAAGARPESADHVVACEKSADLISVAEQCARHNSVGSRISFLQKDARNLVPHDELSRKADVLLLECIDHTLIGDGILHYVQHLRNGFATPNCRLIPAAGVMKGMLVQMRTGERHGVEMTMADAYRWTKDVRPIDMRKEDYVQMSEVFDIFVFDFAENGVEQMVEEMEIIVSRDGIVSALVIWFDLILDEEIVVSTSPFGEADRTLTLGQGICYLQPSECKVKRGGIVPLVVATNGSELAMTINEEKLSIKSKDVVVTGATRFDPRWEGARANLDDAWKKILTNLSYSPKEMRLMQDAVMRLAAQPTAFGIDQGIAERCSLTFLAD